MAELSRIIVQLEAAANGGIEAAMLAEMAKAARPFLPMVRAAIMNTPSAGGVPYNQPPGLRARIARCVQAWADVTGPMVSVGVEVNASLMPDGQKSLPLMLDGEKPWRHPVFGNREHWVSQPSWPYFWGAVTGFGPATQRALERAADIIAAQITG
jgi:hypothetical protein